LAEQYRQMLIQEPLEILTEDVLQKEHDASWQRQREIEAKDTEPFDVWLAKHA
jgi:glutamate--cysteine ligase